MNVAASPAPEVPADGPRRWTFERKLAFSYAGVAALLLLMVSLCCWQAARFVDFNYWVEHTHEVIDRVAEVREQVTEVETNQRGYWILGDDSLRQAAEAAIEVLPQRLQKLGALTADNPAQTLRVQAIEAVVREKVARSRLNLEARQRQELQALLNSGYVTGASQQLSVRLHALAAEMTAVEQGLLHERLAQRRGSLQAAVGSLVALGGLLTFLLIVIYKLGDAELRARRRLSRDLEIARDAALDAARQKSEFLANISHEIRTPLNGIVGMAGLLREQPLDAESRECAATIDACAEALLGIVNDVLDFSKIEAGRLQFAHEPFDLRETIDETLTILGSHTTAKGLELNVVVSSDVPAGLVGDSGRLRQVLLNLLCNAVKFTARGDVTLHVAHPVHHSPGTVADGGPVLLRFEVHDTGIGIAPEGERLLFQAFSQVDGSNARRYGGTGLGLAIAKELVARMGGEIGVESVPGVGSTFWFTARFDADPARAGILANSLPPTAAALLDGWRVLLAGEASTDRRLVQQTFTNWGLFHQSADDGHRALAMLRLAAASGRPFDFALLDADLSGLNGAALAAAVRADAEVAGTRLILLADVAADPAAAAITPTAEADARLPRPVRPRRLLEALRQLAAAPPRAVVASPAPIAAPAGAGPRVLLAEDNPVNRQVALRQLGNLGCQVTDAHNGREALALVEGGGQFDLVLMDVQMPEMDGLETIRQLRARLWPTGVGPPVVAMTANAMEGDRERCLAAGMDDYLPKPVKQDALENMLRRWLPPGLRLADGRPRDRQGVSTETDG